MRINVRGVFMTMREAANRLEDGGRVINISSSVTRLAMPTVRKCVFMYVFARACFMYVRACACVFVLMRWLW